MSLDHSRTPARAPKTELKVLVVNTFLYPRGGDCTYTFTLGDLLRSHGHQVSFWGMTHPLNGPSEHAESFVDCIDFETVNANKTPAAAFRVLSRSIYSLEAKRKLGRLLDRIEPDIVHLNNLHAHLTPSIIDAARERGIPMVWTLHDYKLLCPNTHFLSDGKICERCKKRRFFHCFFKKCKKGSYAASLVATLEAYSHLFLRLSNKVRFFLAPSRFLRDKFIEYGWSPDQVVHIHHLFPFPETSNTSGTGDYILYFGGLLPWKGIMTLLEAMRHLPAIPLRIAGQGGEFDTAEAYIRRHSMDNVNLVGFQSGDALNGLIAGSRFVVMPSEWYENCPSSVMEAMALGKPVVAADIGGIPELVKNQETGYLFEAGNAKDLQAKIQSLYHRPEEIESLGKQAREKILKEFSPESYYQNLIDLYERALEESN